MATEKCILGISPGTRVVGIAVLLNGELIEWKVKTFSERWSSEKRKAILETVKALCAYHNIGLLSIKKVDPLRSSKELDRLIRSLVKQAKRQEIKVRLFALSQLDYGMRSGRRQTKRRLSEDVVERYPEVKHEYLKERNNRQEYYTKMFEAIALAENLDGQML
jgi:hypothetical protein